MQDSNQVLLDDEDRKYSLWVVHGRGKGAKSSLRLPTEWHKKLSHWHLWVIILLYETLQDVMHLCPH